MVLKSLILIKNKEYESIIKYLDLASKSSDADNNDLNNVTLLKLVCFLLHEDYDGLAEFWKRNDSMPLSNTISFTFSENTKTEKTELTTYFNKNTGVINSSIIIPTRFEKKPCRITPKEQILDNRIKIVIQYEKSNPSIIFHLNISFCTN